MKICCNKILNISIGRNITIFSINKSFRGTIMSGICQTCKRKYSHNYLIANKQKFVTYESVFKQPVSIFLVVIMLMNTHLLNGCPIQFYICIVGFENFRKCYNDTKKWVVDNLEGEGGNLSPTRVQDFWFLYNFITISFFLCE